MGNIEFLAFAKVLYPFGFLRPLGKRGVHMEFARAGGYP